MGALGGSLSYLRFAVDGDAADNPGSTYEKSIESRRFRPLTPAGDSMDSAGWVPLEAPYDDELPLTRDLFLFGELIAVAYREDKYVIPRALLQRETDKRLEKIEREEKKEKREMGRAFRKAVEASVLAEMKTKVIPRSRLVDVVWDLRRKEMRVFGRGTIATERCASLLERTFQVRVELNSYAARAFHLDLGSRAQGVLERLSPGWLFPDALKRDPTVTADDGDDMAGAN
jgi:hypothetical protein